MKETLKRIGSIFVDILIVIVFIISTLVVIASITANRTGGQPSVFGYVFSSVQTDSMQGTINKGDFVVGKLIDDNTEIKEGDIISFYDYFKGKQIVITHRVVEIIDPKTDPGYITQGDNEAMSDDIVKSREDIQSVYKFRIPFIGKFIDFLKTPFGFIICLVIPLLAFISWQAYKLIVLFFKNKQAELDEQAENIKKTKSEISEEEKNAIIAEYLAKQKAQEQKSDDADAEKSESDSDGKKT
jgi:signal peptidase